MELSFNVILLLVYRLLLIVKVVAYLRYADETTIIAEDLNELEILVIKIKHGTENAGLELNLANTRNLTRVKN
jgi:Reverse transcriptase (RNA-dependent DNA polymerase).